MVDVSVVHQTGCVEELVAKIYNKTKSKEKNQKYLFLRIGIRLFVHVIAQMENKLLNKEDERCVNVIRCY